MCSSFFYNNLNFINEALAMQYHVHELRVKNYWEQGGDQHMRDHVCLLSNMQIEYDCHPIHLVFNVIKIGFIEIHASQY